MTSEEEKSILETKYFWAKMSIKVRCRHSRRHYSQLYISMKKPWPISVTRIFVFCLHNISIVNICPLCVPGITFWLIDWYSNLATTPCPSYPFVNIPTRQYSIESNQLYIESVLLHEILSPLSVLFNKVVMKQFANMYLPDQWPSSTGRLHYIQWLMMIG